MAMSCPAYGSSSGVSLFYAAEPGAVADPLSETLEWNEVPITSESLAASLTSSISDRITSKRSYANSVVTAGEVSGSCSYEAEFSPFINDMLRAVLQDSATLEDAGDSIMNGSTPRCYAFLKRIQRGTGYDYFVFRGVQIDSMSFNMAPNAFITGELNMTGVRFGRDAKTGTNAVLSHIPHVGAISVSPALAASTATISHTGFTATVDGTATTIVSGNFTIPSSITIPADKFRVLGCLVSKTGVKSVVAGDVKDTAAEALKFMPHSTTDTIMVGHVVVGAGSTQFTGGTTSFDAAGVTEVFTSYSGTVGWKLTAMESGNLMSSVFALQNLTIDDGGGDIGLALQDFSLTLSNQLRAQNALGSGSPYASGVASGRFQATMSANAYYSGPNVIDVMLQDSELSIEFDVLDALGKGWHFLLDKVKVTSAPPPQASGNESDLMSSTEFQAFEHGTNGTVKITQVGDF